ncbi:MAG TPA: beta-ketoacyl-ACP synthase 3 [Solirubrobacteraceae bacterium]|nr:beta-ketoacyl-ACP synthase 3 [Solirubrobacteraceae bacterium]
MYSPTAPAPTRPQLAPRRRLRTAAIAGIGACLPDTVVSNEPIGARIGVDSAWILKRTGIRSRRIAQPHERITDLCARAGRQALDHAGLDAQDINVVLVATTTADDLLPNAAPLVAGALGAHRAGGIDLGAACTGFLSGLTLGAGMIESGRAETVLLIGADFMSRITDPDCRATAAVFADGAGAAVLTVAQDDRQGLIGPISLGADGVVGADLIRVGREERLIRMQGQETFRHAVARMSQATREALTLSGLVLEDIDLFVYHQANGRILRAVGEQLGIDPERVVDCIADQGNTSAGTLPLALDHALSAGRLHQGDRVLLGAFGAGFTWGAGVIEWGAGPRHTS